MQASKILALVTFANLGANAQGGPKPDDLVKYKPTDPAPQVFPINGWNAAHPSCIISNTYSTSSKIHSYNLLFSVVV